MFVFDQNKQYLEDNLKFRCRIPLRNKAKEIVEYTIVDLEDYYTLIKRSWYMFKNSKTKKYALSNSTRMHIMLIGKHPDPRYVIDHINGNSLDNRRCNLVHRTHAQNCQNRNLDKSNTASQYIGVTTARKLWRATIGSIDLGRYQTEIEAAKKYDIAAYILYGEHAKTNKLLSYDELNGLTIEDIQYKNEKEPRELPKHIKIVDKKYLVTMKYKCKMFRSERQLTLEDAIIQRDILYKQIEDLKKKEQEDHINQDIKRNEDGFAIIPVTKKKEIVYAIVDDDKWYDLLLYNWSISNGTYPNTTMNGKSIRMHHYIMETNGFQLDGKVIDHISGNPLDNRRSQLRIATRRQNSQNRTTESGYMGAQLRKGAKKWSASISTESGSITIQAFSNKISALIAYNVIAVREDYVKLNPISIDDYQKYRDKVKLELTEKRNILCSIQFDNIYNKLMNN